MLARLGVSWSYTGDLVLPAVFAHHAPSDHAVRTWVNALGRGGDLFAETVTLFASWVRRHAWIPMSDLCATGRGAG